MKFIFAAFLAFCSTTFCDARLGETKAELTERFGTPISEVTWSLGLNGSTYPIGPMLVFKAQDWEITCQMYDSKCLNISYKAPSTLSGQQIAELLRINKQDSEWLYLKKKVPGMPDPLNEKSWMRDDYSSATLKDDLKTLVIVSRRTYALLNSKENEIKSGVPTEF